jgi:hypothetical protein
MRKYTIMKQGYVLPTTFISETLKCFMFLRQNSGGNEFWEHLRRLLSLTASICLQRL